MPQVVNEISFTLTGPDFEPTGKEWLNATDEERVMSYTRLAELMQQRKRYEIAMGIGASGDKLEPVQEKSRPDGATGKPLDPHYGESQIIDLMRTAIGRKSATLFWQGTRPKGRALTFGQILRAHANGNVRGAPARDHLGLSPAGQNWCRREIREWWKRWLKRKERRPWGRFFNRLFRSAR